MYNHIRDQAWHRPDYFYLQLWCLFGYLAVLRSSISANTIMECFVSRPTLKESAWWRAIGNAIQACEVLLWSGCLGWWIFVSEQLPEYVDKFYTKFSYHWVLIAFVITICLQLFVQEGLELMRNVRREKASGATTCDGVWLSFWKYATDSWNYVDLCLLASSCLLGVSVTNFARAFDSSPADAHFSKFKSPLMTKGSIEPYWLVDDNGATVEPMDFEENVLMYITKVRINSHYRDGYHQAVLLVEI